MTWIGNDATAFNGLEYHRSRPREFAFEEDVEAVISDTALVYQFLANQDLDGNAWSGASGSGMPGYQDHSGSGRGCLLGHPLSTTTFGKGVSAGTAYHGSIKHPEIDASQSSAGTEYKHLYRWPCFIPSGNSSVMVHVRAGANFGQLSPRAVRYTAAFASAGDDDSYLTIEGDPANWYSKDADGNGWWFELPITTPGQIYVLGIDVDIGATDEKVSVYSIRVLPIVWRTVVADEPVDFGTGTRGTTYQAATSTSQTKISDVHTAAGRSFNAMVAHQQTMNHNHAFELLTDTSLDGETPGTAGHDHDGTDSEVIGMCLQSCCLGWHQADSASAEGLTASEGDAGRCPEVQPTGVTSGAPDSTDIFGLTAFCAPQYAGTTTRSVNWAAVYYDGDTASVSIRAETSNAVADSPFDNLSSYADCAGAAGAWGICRGTVDVLDGALNWARLRAFLTKGGSFASIAGFCYWVE